MVCWSYDHNDYTEIFMYLDHILRMNWAHWSQQWNEEHNTCHPISFYTASVINLSSNQPDNRTHPTTTVCVCNSVELRLTRNTRGAMAKPHANAISMRKAYKANAQLTWRATHNIAVIFKGPDGLTTRLQFVHSARVVNAQVIQNDTIVSTTCAHQKQTPRRI